VKPFHGNPQKNSGEGIAKERGMAVILGGREDRRGQLQ